MVGMIQRGDYVIEDSLSGPRFCRVASVRDDSLWVERWMYGRYSHGLVKVKAGSVRTAAAHEFPDELRGRPFLRYLSHDERSTLSAHLIRLIEAASTDDPLRIAELVNEVVSPGGLRTALLVA